MQKIGLISLVLVFTLCVIPAFAQKGNDLPKDMDKLYSLQIIAYEPSNCPQDDNYDTSRRQIAVRADLGSTHPNGQNANDLTIIRDNDILLAPGPFRVLDGNACIDGVAEFQLPIPEITGSDPVNDPTFSYQVWLRLVGKPYTGIDVATCAFDTMGTPDKTDDIVRCSMEEVELTRTKGKNSAPKFTNVSRELLSICLNTDSDPECDVRVPLFAAPYYGYWWDWGTDGKAHAQLVFLAPKEE